MTNDAKPKAKRKPRVVKKKIDNVVAITVSNEEQDVELLLQSEEVHVDAVPSIPKKAQEVAEKKFIGFHPVTGKEVYI